VYRWLAVQKVQPWSVGIYYRQVVHFKNFPIIAIGSGWDKPVLSEVEGVSESFLFSQVGSGECFKKFQILNLKLQTNFNCQKSNLPSRVYQYKLIRLWRDPKRKKIKKTLAPKTETCYIIA